MHKFLISLTLMTSLGLVIVYGEVEAIRVGYDIRQLSIHKREMMLQLKDAEIQIASLTALENLEKTMLAQQIDLVKPKLMRIAKANKSQIATPSNKRSLFQKLQLRTAQASPKS